MLVGCSSKDLFPHQRSQCFASRSAANDDQGRMLTRADQKEEKMFLGPEAIITIRASKARKGHKASVDLYHTCRERASRAKNIRHTLVWGKRGILRRRTKPSRRSPLSQSSTPSSKHPSFRAVSPAFRRLQGCKNCARSATFHLCIKCVLLLLYHRIELSLPSSQRLLSRCWYVQVVQVVVL